MIGVDHGVGAVPFRLGGECVHEKPAENSSDGGHEQQQPRVERLGDWREPTEFHLPRRTDRRLIADDDAECIMLDDPRGQIEPDRADTRDDPDQDGGSHEPQLRTKPQRPQPQKLGKPVQWTGQPIRLGRRIVHWEPTCTVEAGNTML